MKLKQYQSLIIIFISSFFIFYASYLLSIDKIWIFFVPFFLYGFLSFCRIDNLLWLVVFLTPLSVPINELGFFFEKINFSFPTEFILFVLMFILILQIIFFFEFFKKIFNHKATYCLLLYLIWMLFSCITSTHPIVSFKVLLTRIWYIVPFYFFMTFLFRKKKNILSFILTYTIPLCIVVIYTLVQQSEDFFDSKLANGAVHPFFNDHTSYGAILAFFIPSIFILVTDKKKFKKWNILFITIFVILLIGLVFSYTRAAWISFFVATLFGLAIKIKLRFRHLIPTAFVLIGFLFLAQDYLISKKESSDSVFEHFQSTSNITTDASNMERLNRWDCAIKMFAEKTNYWIWPGNLSI